MMRNKMRETINSHLRAVMRIGGVGIAVGKWSDAVKGYYDGKCSDKR